MMNHDVYLANTKTVYSDNDPGFEITTNGQVCKMDTNQSWKRKRKKTK